MNTAQMIAEQTAPFATLGVIITNTVIFFLAAYAIRQATKGE